MTIFDKKKLSVEQIRHGLNAYILICREDKNDHLYLEDDAHVKKDKDKSSSVFGAKVHQALRLINMSISQNILKAWYDHVKFNLEWNQEERRKFEKESREANIDIPYILPHEFLFLLCNCENRLSTINRMHRPDLSS